jgi:hypothetical protein
MREFVRVSVEELASASNLPFLSGGGALGAAELARRTFMKSLRNIVIGIAAAVSLTGCMHRGANAGYASGDVAIDSLSASRTALLRVDNSYPSEVRIYTLIGHQKNYVAKAMPNQVRTWVLDPNLFPAPKITFVAEAKDGSMKRVLGPFRVNRGETVELVVTDDFDAARASIHRSTP